MIVDIIDENLLFERFQRHGLIHSPLQNYMRNNISEVVNNFGKKEYLKV